MARIYTRTGDKGETGLFGGRRTAKNSARVVAYGTVDELNSAIGLAKAFAKDQWILGVLSKIQDELFTLGADLASPSSETDRPVPRVSASMVTELEHLIDEAQTQLPELKAFILPSGQPGGALLHFARSVARRAERRIVALSKTESVGDQMIPYMNRLSDLLFVLARLANRRDGASELEWHAKSV